MADVTQILQAIEMGEVGANQRLLAIVYSELRSMAASEMSREKPGHTLVPTALVHEAYLRLVGSGNSLHFQTRGHFFAAVAEVMRRILIDHARRKHSQSAVAALIALKCPWTVYPHSLPPISGSIWTRH